MKYSARKCQTLKPFSSINVDFVFSRPTTLNDHQIRAAETLSPAQAVRPENPAASQQVAHLGVRQSPVAALQIPVAVLQAVVLLCLQTLVVALRPESPPGVVAGIRMARLLVVLRRLVADRPFLRLRRVPLIRPEGLDLLVLKYLCRLVVRMVLHPEQKFPISQTGLMEAVPQRCSSRCWCLGG